MDFKYVDNDATVAVAMSGGVDSSTVAALIKDAGYKKVIGITLYLYDNNESKGIIAKDSNFIEDAKRVASKLQIEHVVLDLRDRFNDFVISPFVNGYISGVTPSPCVNCNREIKFGALLDESKKLGADILVTGHYIKWQMEEDGTAAIYKNKETIRDQSYFLAKVRKDALSSIRFPLANMNKSEVRLIADNFGLHVSQKPSSNDICFAGGKSYANIIQKALSDNQEGDILDISGNVVGKHKGLFNYTVGQRKGIGINGFLVPMYVIAVDPLKNTITIGEKEHLLSKEIEIYDVNWMGNDNFMDSKRELLVKVRASQVPVLAEVIPLENNKAKVVFKEDVYGVARGQICAFYNNDKLMGGGNI